jgi:hypothetical protein
MRAGEERPKVAGEEARGKSERGEEKPVDLEADTGGA